MAGSLVSDGAGGLLMLCGKLFVCDPESDSRFCCMNCGNNTRVTIKVPCGPITAEYQNVADWDPQVCENCTVVNAVWELDPLGGFQSFDWCEWEISGLTPGFGGICLGGGFGVEFRLYCCINGDDEVVLYAALTTLGLGSILYKELAVYPNDGECHNYDLTAQLPLTMDSFAIPPSAVGAFCNPSYDPGEEVFGCDLSNLVVIIDT